MLCARRGLQFFTLIVISLCFTLTFAKTANSSKKPIQIGIIFSLTGTEAPEGEAARKGALLAEQSINDAGGVLGRPIQLVVRDAKTNPLEVVKISKEFAKDPNIFAVVGFTSTYTLEFGAPILAKAKKITFSTESSSPFITKRIPKYLFLISFTDNVQSAAAAEYIYDFLHIKTAAILFEQDRQYGKNLQKYFSERYQNLGGKILLTLPFKHDDQNLDNQIRQIKALQPQPACLFLAIDDPTYSAYFVKTLRKGGLSQPIIGGDGFVSHELLTLAKGESNNVSFMTHGVVNPDLIHFLPGLMRQYLATEKFFKAYQELFHSAPFSVGAVLSYDALNFLAAAINQTKSLDTEKILKTIHFMEKFVGVSGEITYNHERTNPIKTVSIITIQGNKAMFLGNWIPTEIPSP